MPNSSNQQPVWVGGASNANPDNYSEVAPGYAPGDLGVTTEWNDRSYQRVVLDSGATASSPAGVVAANELAYWKDRSKYIVTNDSSQALFNNTASSFRNNVAGVFRSAVTAGNACFVLQRGRQINVKEAGSATAGMILISDTSTTAAQGLGVAINTAPNCQQLGTVYTATAANVAVVDVDIASIP